VALEAVRDGDVFRGDVALRGGFRLDGLLDRRAAGGLHDLFDRALGGLLQRQLAAEGLAHVDNADRQHRQDRRDQRELDDGGAAVVAERAAGENTHPTSLTRRPPSTGGRPAATHSLDFLNLFRVTLLPLKSIRRETNNVQDADVLPVPLYCSSWFGK